MQNPETLYPCLPTFGADILASNADVSPRLHYLADMIKSEGKKADWPLTLLTPPEFLFLSFTLFRPGAFLMTVNPGFVGQKFIP